VIREEALDTRKRALVKLNFLSTLSERTFVDLQRIIHYRSTSSNL
jgi:hypothetical protein